MKLTTIFSCILIVLFTFSCSSESNTLVLVFSKTEAFHHESITAGTDAIFKLSGEKGFDVTFTEDACQFNEKELAQYKAVVFLNTTGDADFRDEDGKHTGNLLDTEGLNPVIPINNVQENAAGIDFSLAPQGFNLSVQLVKEDSNKGKMMDTFSATAVRIEKRSTR